MKLNFRDRGEGNAVILIHGLFGSLANLSSLAKELEEMFRVVSVDLRNHGASDHSQKMDLSGMAGDISETMRFLGISEAAIVGHSLGGKVGMQMALSFPNLVTNLVVADIAPVKYSSQHNPLLDGLQHLNEMSVISRSEADDVLSKYETDRAVRAFLLKNLVRENSGQYRLRLNLAAIIENYNVTLTAAPQGEPSLCPVLFLKGQNSAYIQNKHYKEINRIFKRASVRVIDGAGHWVHTEKPELFNQLVSEFLING